MNTIQSRGYCHYTTPQRRDRDSNPGYPLRYTAFPMLLLKPLGHLSIRSGGRDSNPQQSVWKTGTLPLSYLRKVLLSTFLLYYERSKCIQLCAPRWIRTTDLSLRRRMLYPAELLVHVFNGCPGPESNRQDLRRSILSRVCLPISPPGRIKQGVPKAGLEPARPKPFDFESNVFTCFTTWALVPGISASPAGLQVHSTG